MGRGNKNKEKITNKEELDKLYEIYMRVQTGDKSALDELFKATDNKQISRADEINKEYQMSHMDNILDSAFVLDMEQSRQEKGWVNSASSKVAFQFPCLNKMLYKKKKRFLSTSKNTGYENGKKAKNNGHSKFYEGEYDISDFNELMYETVIEIFNTKTDENKCLTLDGKKNVENPICDGISLLKNISYFTSRKINKRAKNSYLDVYGMEYGDKEPQTDLSDFDKYAFKKFIESERGTSRLAMYAEYLAWLKRNDVHKLFKVNACDIHAIIDTIMNRADIFMKDMSGDNEIGLGMRFVTQEKLQEMIMSRHNINIEQENISKDLEIIEQRLLDHLFYSLNYRIGKAEESKGIYEKESERFLYGLEEIKYIKVFSRTSYKIYNESIRFINSDINSEDFDDYFREIKKYEDMVVDIVSLVKGEKMYDMVNLIFEDNDDLVEDKRKALADIASTVILFYQKKEEEYIQDRLTGYSMKGIAKRRNGCWETKLEDDFLHIKSWSGRNVKKPIRHSIDKEKLMVYCGYVNFYFCNVEDKICYRAPKDRRIVSRANKNHEIFMYDVS